MTLTGTWWEETREADEKGRSQDYREKKSKNNGGDRRKKAKVEQRGVSRIKEEKMRKGQKKNIEVVEGDS